MGFLGSILGIIKISCGVKGICFERCEGAWLYLGFEEVLVLLGGFEKIRFCSGLEEY